MNFRDEKYKDYSNDRLLSLYLNELYFLSSSFFEYLEEKGQIRGNGHHTAQKIVKVAEEEYNQHKKVSNNENV